MLMWLILPILPDQSADCFYADCDCCLRVMDDRIFHAKGISLLIAYYKEGGAAADSQVCRHDK